MTKSSFWWQKGVVYQIYPRSFADSNGDGVGDLPGITAHLDYLQEIGIDAIWISPIFPSPMADFGYDISNFEDIEPVFGTLTEFDTLVEATHAHGLKILLDYVPGHTSDQHPWFIEAQKDRTNPKRDWFIWRDPASDGSPPNNWISSFGGPAWTFHPHTGQYYLHSYLSAQPDLNWRNPEVQAAMFDALRFWLKRGVDGFRVDVMHRIVKDDQFRDNPLNPDWKPGMAPFESLIPVYNRDWHEIQPLVRQMRKVIDEFPDRVLIGEAYLPNDRLIIYYGYDAETQQLLGAHLPFNFQLISLNWDAKVIRNAVDAYEAVLPPGAWPNWVLGNHDRHRFISRYGKENARTATMLLLTLRGTPTVYYGDEIGMADVPIPVERVQDPYEKQVPGIDVGRDPERTPLQWDASPNAGFCPPDITPWLPIADDYQQVNVATEHDDPASMLTLFKKLTALRRATPALSIGDYRSLNLGDSSHIYAYERSDAGTRVLVLLNFGDNNHALDLSAFGNTHRLLLSTDPNRAPGLLPANVELGAREGVIIAIDK